MRAIQKKRLAIALGCLATATLSISLLTAKDGGQVCAEAYVLTPETEILTEYALDTTLAVPSASFEKDGKTYAADYAYLVYPDNQAKSGDEFLLSQIGQYSLVYTATIDGEKVVSEKNFVTAEPLYVVGNAASYVEYQEELITSTIDINSEAHAPYSGIKVGLVSGDSFTYNKPINLNEVGDNALFRLYPYNCTKVFGDADGYPLQSEWYYIRLTDCYDPTNYLTIKLRWYGQGAMYVQAGMSNQPNVGLEIGTPEPKPIANPGSEKHVYIDGQGYRAFYDVRYGTYAMRRGDGEGMRFYFDVETKELFVQNSNSASKLLVTDLDNTDIYGDKGYGGFTTGEVYLTVKAEGYRNGATHANFELAEIAGAALENKQFYVDENAPIATIDKYDGDVVYVAKNQPFEAFKANYADVNGVKESKITAYYGYGTDMATEVSVVDGKFIPTREGMYTLVYTAKDIFGVESKTLARVYCVECTDGKAVQFSVEKLTSVAAGSTVALPVPTVDSINKGEFYKAHYVHKASGDITEIEGENFVPVRLGAHELVYTYGDAYLQYTYSYEFTVSSSNNVVFGEIVSPKYLIKGFKYTLEDVIATTFSGEKEEDSATTVYAAVDGGGYSATAIDSKGYLVTANESVRFKFVKYGESVESEAIPVINVKSGEDLAVEKYFVGDFTKTSHVTSGVLLRANAVSGDASVEFANDLTFSNFVFAFDIPAEAAGFNGLKLTFTDYYDRTNVKEVLLEKNGSGVKLSSGDSFVEMDKGFVNGSFRLQTSRGKLFDGTDGVTFTNDFTFERVFLKVTLLGIDGVAGINVGEINGQSLAGVTADDFAPAVLFSNPDTGYAKMGTTAIVHKAVGADVLCPYYVANLRVNVKGPDGKFVYAKDGTLLSGESLADKAYEIDLNAYGRYSITYSYEDQAGNLTKVIDFYNAVDDAAPTISLTDVAAGSTVQASLYQPMTAASYAVSDNVSKENQIKVWILVESPAHECVYLKGTTAFTVDKLGVWTVKYLCVDLAGNYSIAEYYIEVK